jgi:hypothetical protein
MNGSKWSLRAPGDQRIIPHPLGGFHQESIYSIAKTEWDRGSQITRHFKASPEIPLTPSLLCQYETIRFWDRIEVD